MMKNKNVSMENKYIKSLKLFIVILIVANLITYFVYFSIKIFDKDPYFKFNYLKDEIMSNNFLALKKEILYYSNITNMINLNFKNLYNINNYNSTIIDVLEPNNGKNATEISNNQYCINVLASSNICQIDENINNLLSAKNDSFTTNSYLLYDSEGLIINNFTDIILKNLKNIKMTIIDNIWKPLKLLLLLDYKNNIINTIIKQFHSTIRINFKNDKGEPGNYFLVYNFPFQTNFTFSLANIRNKLDINNTENIIWYDNLTMKYETTFTNNNDYKILNIFDFNYNGVINNINKDNLYNQTNFFYYNYTQYKNVTFNSKALDYKIFERDFTKTFFKNDTIEFNNIKLKVTQSINIKDIYNRDTTLIFAIFIILDWISYIILYIYVLYKIINLLIKFDKSVYNLLLGNFNLLRFKLNTIKLVILNEIDGPKTINKNDFIFEKDNEIKEFISDFIEIMDEDMEKINFNFKDLEQKLVIQSFKKKEIVNKYNENFWNKIKKKIIFENNNCKIK